MCVSHSQLREHTDTRKNVEVLGKSSWIQTVCLDQETPVSKNFSAGAMQLGSEPSGTPQSLSPFSLFNRSL